MHFSVEVLLNILFAFVAVLVFTKFPVGPDEDEGKCWRTVKTKINAKCRAQRFAISGRIGIENLRPN